MKHMQLEAIAELRNLTRAAAAEQARTIVENIVGFDDCGSFDIAMIMATAAFAQCTDPNVIAELTGSEGSIVDQVAARMCRSGVWTKNETHHDNWFVSAEGIEPSTY